MRWWRTLEPCDENELLLTLETNATKRSVDGASFIQQIPKEDGTKEKGMIYGASRSLYFEETRDLTIKSEFLAFRFAVRWFQRFWSGKNHLKCLNTPLLWNFPVLEMHFRTGCQETAWMMITVIKRIEELKMGILQFCRKGTERFLLVQHLLFARTSPELLLQTKTCASRDYLEALFPSKTFYILCSLEARKKTGKVVMDLVLGSVIVSSFLSSWIHKITMPIMSGWTVYSNSKERILLYMLW